VDRAAALNLFHSPLEYERTGGKRNATTFRASVRKRLELKTAIENG